MQWIRLQGGYFEIGYQLGCWWGRYFKRLQRSKEGRCFLGTYKELYQSGLADEWDDKFYPLMANTIKYYPEVMQEIAGISQGATETGFPASIPGIFALMLEEAQALKHSCSAIVVRKQNGFLLIHNEEYDHRYPLCFAKVTLQTGRLKKRFISISYPFELLGGVAGMTTMFAFQNNSIGYAGYEEQLKDSWSARLPKPVLLRKLLEQLSLKDIKQLYARHHLTMPFHQYVCFAARAYSMEVRPVLDPSSRVERQLTIHKITALSDVHTNHFSRRGERDSDWHWGNEVEDSDSQKRRSLLCTIASNQPIRTAYASLQQLARARRYRKYTSATLCFHAGSNQMRCDATYYFNDRLENVGSSSLPTTK